MPDITACVAMYFPAVLPVSCQHLSPSDFLHHQRIIFQLLPVLWSSVFLQLFLPNGFLLAVQIIIIIRDFFITMQFLSISGYFFFRCNFNCILNSFLPDRRFPDLFPSAVVSLFPDFESSFPAFFSFPFRNKFFSLFSGRPRLL